uniref:Retrotransposon gag domain-containing protein n=1 Tax=Cajanus cajan TaxID=3821 RepID=A0A151R343_CAJCA|nr:hypothetical protein KK1_045287 [Cajanus cajan]KYP36885.1 hypothetical protein KK1_041961 [Cajanus cajan]
MGEQPYNGPRERTLREMVAPDFTYESLCIQYPEEDVPFVLKTGLIHLLPKFHGHADEDPHKYLKEFHIVCYAMKPPDVKEDHIYLKAFPHSLEGVAKDWLYYLAPRSIPVGMMLKECFWGNSSLPQVPLQSEKIYQGSGNLVEKACMSTGRDSRNCVQAVLTTRFLSSCCCNISIRG